MSNSVYKEMCDILKDTPTIVNNEQNKVGILIYRPKFKGMNKDMVIYFLACDQLTHYMVGGNVNTTLQGGNKKELEPINKYYNSSWTSQYGKERKDREHKFFIFDKYSDAYSGIFTNRPWEAINIKKTMAKNTEMLLNAYREANVEVYNDDIILYIHIK